MIIQLPIQKVLTNSAKIEIDWMREQEKAAVRHLLNAVVLEGQTYPQAQPLSESEFAAYWLSSDAFVARLIDDKKTSAPGEVVGAFYLKPNFPGRCSHICNAGFIVQRRDRGQRLGRVMGKAMLEIAASRGYRGLTLPTHRMRGILGSPSHLVFSLLPNLDSGCSLPKR